MPQMCHSIISVKIVEGSLRYGVGEDALAVGARMQPARLPRPARNGGQRSTPHTPSFGRVPVHTNSSGSLSSDLAVAQCLIVALASIGTAVTLYPVVRRQNESVALGFVGARILEAGMIFTGVVSLLSLVTLRAGPGRRGRSKCSRTRYHRRVARRHLQLGVPARAEPHTWHQRTAAGHPAVPVPARAPHHSVVGADRRPLLICTVMATIFSRFKLGSPNSPHSRGCLGTVARPLAHRQGLQALCHHGELTAASNAQSTGDVSLRPRRSGGAARRPMPQGLRPPGKSGPQADAPLAAGPVASWLSAIPAGMRALTPVARCRYARQALPLPAPPHSPSEAAPSERLDDATTRRLTGEPAHAQHLRRCPVQR